MVTDEVFTMKLGTSQMSEVLGNSSIIIQPKVERSGPTPRMSAMMAIQRSVLYLYGGVLEKDEKQFYLGDMYSLGEYSLYMYVYVYMFMDIIYTLILCI